MEEENKRIGVHAIRDLSLPITQEGIKAFLEQKVRETKPDSKRFRKYLMTTSTRRPLEL